MTLHFTSKAGTAKTKAMFNDRRFFFEKRNDRKQQNAGEKQNESIICMTSRVHEVLLRRSKEKQTDYLFTNEKGDGPRNHATSGIKKAMKRAGIKEFTIHDFRHTCASRLIQNGLSLYEVASILGHTDVQTTQRYAHLESRDVSQRARDIMEALNSGPDGAAVEFDAGVAGLGS